MFCSVVFFACNQAYTKDDDLFLFFCLEVCDHPADTALQGLLLHELDPAGVGEVGGPGDRAVAGCEVSPLVVLPLLLLLVVGSILHAFQAFYAHDALEVRGPTNDKRQYINEPSKNIFFILDVEKIPSDSLKPRKVVFQIWYKKNDFFTVVTCPKLHPSFLKPNS